ncbi:MAG: class I SAM-dependent methyltransferase [Oscillospiraceae bacterium]|nr:class I SAM-dependent methyltransferase [Oscillospiraceae bacterium]
MSEKPYYLAYENRYQKVFAAGGERWGHSPDDETLAAALEKWSVSHRLRGESVIEFACGEGAAGVILSRLGCIYHGVDIAPSAVEKAREALRDFPSAQVTLLDMVKQAPGGIYAAALDCMGFHMLVADSDRESYLRNAYDSLKSGAPMLFFREVYRRNAYEGAVDSLEQWLAITKADCVTPQQRFAKSSHGDAEVWLPNLPARAKNKDGYITELRSAGFAVDDFIEMDLNEQCPYSASIYAHKS